MAMIGLTGRIFHQAVLKLAGKLTAHVDVFKFTVKKQLCHCLFPGSSKHNIVHYKERHVRGLSFYGVINMSC